ncbi:MAG: endopeptidase La [Chloroflexota bacterium]|nr:endopeptidase La [Chloroflexota bacterium]MDQ5866426.1 endopeptidase La [Chloroflexota bacterium]
MVSPTPERDQQGPATTPQRGTAEPQGSNDQASPRKVPLLPLSDNVIFPRSVYPLALSGEHAQQLAAAAQESGGYVAMFLQREDAADGPTGTDLYPVGTLARMADLRPGPDDLLEFQAEGLERVVLRRIVQYEPYAAAIVESLPEEQTQAEGVANLFEQAHHAYAAVLAGTPAEQQMLPILEETTEPLDLAYLVAATIPISAQAKQAILEAEGAHLKLSQVLLYLNKVQELKANRQAGGETHSPSASEAPRPYGLNQTAIDRADLEKRITAAGLSPQAMKQAERELERLSLLTPSSPDYNMVRTYLQWLADMPWRVDEEPDFELDGARAILDRDHFGLQEVKARIIEYLAVRKLRKQRAKCADDCGGDTVDQDPPRQPVLCLVGPPGVGKTSLGRSIAEALNRPFVRISLGGVSDEAEVRGHRRTYLGAMPGRIVQSLARVGSAQPVMMLDELDKLAAKPSGGGDPTAALLDVLDPEQQREFVDHYVEVPFDISCLFFVATANNMDPVPEALRDRLEVIRISGYTEEEKREIALRHLIPRQMEWHALTEQDVQWQPEAVLEIIRSYTQEAGVRQLEREIATVCRRVATTLAEHGAQHSAVIADPDFIAEVLGTPRYLPEEPSATDEPGVVTGVFWTPVGGDIMHIEALLMPGGKTLTITGQLGEVMRESAQTALSWVRAHAEELGIDPTFYDRHDIHLHIPSGSVAKDGPSAGISLATALVSLLTKTPVSSELAMTGEITLRGRVLPVGGIKEKVLAARRAGVRKIVLPTQNRRDLDEIQPELLEDLQIVTADTMEDVLSVAFPRTQKRGLLPRRYGRVGVGHPSPRRRLMNLPGVARGR